MTLMTPSLVPLMPLMFEDVKCKVSYLLSALPRSVVEIFMSSLTFHLFSSSGQNYNFGHLKMCKLLDCSAAVPKYSLARQACTLLFLLNIY